MKIKPKRLFAEKRKNAKKLELYYAML